MLSIILVVELAAELGFNKEQRRVRCATHIFNLVAQSSLFGTDKDAFKNGDENLTEEQQFLEEWRKEGPLGTLIDFIYLICSPQKYEQFYAFQREENAMLPRADFKVLELVKPVKTRWNSYLMTFKRAVELQGPISSIMQHDIDEWNRKLATIESS